MRSRGSRRLAVSTHQVEGLAALRHRPGVRRGDGESGPERTRHPLSDVRDPGAPSLRGCLFQPRPPRACPIRCRARDGPAVASIAIRKGRSIRTDAMTANAGVWNFRGLLSPPSRSQFEHRQFHKGFRRSARKALCEISTHLMLRAAQDRLSDRLRHARLANLVEFRSARWGQPFQPVGTSHVDMQGDATRRRAACCGSALLGEYRQKSLGVRRMGCTGPRDEGVRAGGRPGLGWVVAPSPVRHCIGPRP